MGLKLLLCAALLASTCLAQTNEREEMTIWGNKLHAQLSAGDIELLKGKMRDSDFVNGPKGVHLLSWLSTKGLINEIPQPLADAMSLEDRPTRTSKVESLVGVTWEALKSRIAIGDDTFKPIIPVETAPPPTNQPLPAEAPKSGNTNIADMQMAQWGEHLARVVPEADKQALANVIRSEPGVLQQDRLFELTIDMLKHKAIPIELPPALRQTTSIRDPRKRLHVIERFMEIAVTAMLGCPSQIVLEGRFPLPLSKIPECEENVNVQNRQPESKKAVLRRLHALTQQLLNGEENGQNAALTPASQVAATLFELTHGPAKWQNLGPEERQRFFKGVARKIVSLGTAPSPVDLLVAETMKLVSCGEPQMPPFRVSCAELAKFHESALTPDDDQRLINGVSEELASAVQEGRLKTKDDAIAMSQQLVQELSGQAALRA
ncbi:unnamed protein product, partial [Mesorhabditis spiculigera]